jgi:ATP/maltotriose-dependent transcriptional regulator MalT
VGDRPSVLSSGRGASAAGSWAEAFEAFALADASSELGSDDLLEWARAAYMLGRDDDYVGALERAHRAFLDLRELPQAARSAFWIGHSLMFRGSPAKAEGWFAVGSRLVKESGAECAEQGYLLAPVWLGQMGAGEWAGGYETACEAAGIGERAGDADLVWLARDEQARALLHLGRVDEAIRLVDEVLVVLESGRVSPIVSGIIYCNTIAFCRDTYQYQRAAEWTDGLTRWCARQPQMVAHNGLCLVHRAEVLELRGSWDAALHEARTAAERFTAGALNQIACGKAHYRAAEIYRLRGLWHHAERSYEDANRLGCSPQPGLALLRLERGAADVAAAAIRRTVGEHTGPLERAGLLPAYVRIMLATGDLDAAQAASRELEQLVARVWSDSLRAMADHASSQVAYAEGDWARCLQAARSAFDAWHRMEAPYDAACARVMVALACRQLGDHDSANLDLGAAREVFAGLNAAPDLRHIDDVLGRQQRHDANGLSRREIEVLRLLVAGSSNRQIAATLVISERTVARHLQNIYAKLGVASRTAASAFAHEHGLV